MKKKYWIILIIVILIISPLIFLVIFYSICPSCPPFGGCRWKLEKDYNLLVNDKQEATRLLNDYFTAEFAGWENITAEQINVTDDEFVTFGRGWKIDRNGKIFYQFCPV